MKSQPEVSKIVKDLAGKIAQHARQRDADLTAILRSPMTPATQHQAIRSMHTHETATQRQAMSLAAREQIAAYRQGAVLAVEPDGRPSGAAESSWASAQAALIPLMSPPVLSRAITAWAKAGNIPMLTLGMLAGESLASYKKEFMGSMPLASAMVDARAVLDARPEIVASRAADRWCDTVVSDLNTLDEILSSDRPIEALDVHLSTYAMPEIL